MVSTEERVRMVEEMQESEEFIDYQLAYLEDREVERLYLKWKGGEKPNVEGIDS